MWAALGDPKHYIEPFFGSGAVLLNRPDPHHVLETVCDRDGFVCNAWRAMQADPDGLARWCDWPVSHLDLNARRRVLLREDAELSRKLSEDAEYHDLKIAGYWIWCACAWIGSGLTCKNAIPRLSQNGNGINSGKIPGVSRRGKGINSGQIPYLQKNGRGCNKNSKAIAGQIPYIAGTGVIGVGVNSIKAGPVAIAGQIPSIGNTGPGRGVHAGKIPELARQGKGINSSERGPVVSSLDVRDPYRPELYAWFRRLSERLRLVRTVCGDWTRVCGGDWQDDCGICGMYFDPPYDKQNRSQVYAHESQVEQAVEEWVLDRGARDTFRIVVSGYEGSYTRLVDAGWRVEEWKARGGYGVQAKGDSQGKANAKRERLFYSPRCLGAEEVEKEAGKDLFD